MLLPPVSKSPVEIGAEVSEITLNKHTDKNPKNVSTITIMYTFTCIY